MDPSLDRVRAVRAAHRCAGRSGRFAALRLRGRTPPASLAARRKARSVDSRDAPSGALERAQSGRRTGMRPRPRPARHFARIRTGSRQRRSTARRPCWEEIPDALQATSVSPTPAGSGLELDRGGSSPYELVPTPERGGRQRQRGSSLRPIFHDVRRHIARDSETPQAQSVRRRNSAPPGNAEIQRQNRPVFRSFRLLARELRRPVAGGPTRRPRYEPSRSPLSKRSLQFPRSRTLPGRKRDKPGV